MGTARRLVGRKSADASRHLRWEAFEARIQAGPPSTHRICGKPTIDLFVDPGGSRIGMFVFEAPLALPNSPLAAVSIAEVVKDQLEAVEIATANTRLFRDFYSFCCTVADRIQLGLQPVGHALSETLDSWAGLLKTRSLLSVDQQIGLLGELEFLIKAADALGWRIASKSWKGPDDEEHDFSLPFVDVEVKSTRGEKRVHQIGSLTQLLPKAGRPLFLVSVQLTRSGPGSGSRTLPGAVARVLLRAAKVDPLLATGLRLQLQHLGWSDDDASYYTEAFRLRTPMCAIPVDRSFPAILPSTLAHLGTERLSRIQRVSYSVDVDGLGFPDTTPAFKALFRK